MLKQVIAAAILSTSLLAGAAAPAIAMEDGGEESTFWADHMKKVKAKQKTTTKRTVDKNGRVTEITRDAKGKIIAVKNTGKKVKVVKKFKDDKGRTVTVKLNRDGSKRLITRDADGNIVKRQTIGGPRPFIHDHTTGNTVIGFGGGVRVMIGPFGIQFNN